MSTDKKSVILYCDIIYTVEQLDDADAGLLFKHYLRYINDQNPEPPSKLIKIVFEPIKQNLKRDLKKWENTLESRSIAGKAGATARWQNVASDSKRIEVMAKIAVNDTVNDKVNDTNTAVNTATNKSEDFMQRLIPYMDTYGKEMMRDFFNYWTEKNEGGKKMRFEMQKVFDVSRRLSTWSERAKTNKFNTNGKPTYKTVNEQINDL